MLFLIIITSCILVLYLFLILTFIFGWSKLKTFENSKNKEFDTFVSVIIALKNEEQNVSILLNSLLNQSLHGSHFEIILVNDHSTDNTLQVCEEFAKKNPNCFIINLLEGEGKKKAIFSGLKQAKGQLIVTTDADCIHHEKWLKTILEFYQTYSPKMIIGPVLMQSESFFQTIQAIDFYSLMVSGASASAINRPILCNGANLSFEKDIALENNDLMNQKFISGDDIFLLLNTKKRYKNKIMFLKSTDALVYTKPETSFKRYFQQRKRWASKSKGYRDNEIIFTAIVVLLVNFYLLSLLALSITLLKYLFLFVSLFVAKSIVDFIFLIKCNSFFKMKKLKAYFLAVQTFNLIMVPLIAFFGIFTRQKWEK